MIWPMILAFSNTRWNCANLKEVAYRDKIPADYCPIADFDCDESLKFYMQKSILFALTLL